MKKCEIAKGLDTKANAFFIAASVSLAANSILSNLSRAFDLGTAAETILAFIVVLFSITSYVTTIKGFVFFDKNCRLSEKNENYYEGRNLVVFTVICIVLTVILSIAALIFSMFLAEYNSADGLTASDVQARNNVLVIVAIINVLMQLFTISTPFIFYLLNTYKFANGNKTVTNLALLTMIVMIVHLVIGILNSVYSVRGSENNFLPGFTSILNSVKYVVLLIFFFVRKSNIETTEYAE